MRRSQYTSAGRTPCPAASNRRLRAGYTLIELLIAVSLVAVLMTAVWGLISMYTRLQTAGAESTAEQQLVRSVMQLIEDDLVSVPLAPGESAEEITDPFAAFDPVESNLGSSDFDSDSFSIVFGIDDLVTEQDAGPANLSFRGTSNALSITVPRPARPLPAMSAIDQLNQLGSGSEGFGERLPEGVAPAVEEFHTIVYQFQPFGSIDDGGLPFGLYRVQAQAAQLQMIINRRSRPDDIPLDDVRLERQVIEELLFPPEEESDSRGVPRREATCDLIPDVVRCRFQYFDGQWQDDWHNDRANTLPSAVRVSLDVISTIELDQLRQVYTSEGPPGRLEQRLMQMVASPESARDRTQATAIEQLRVVPRTYSSVMLLDSTTQRRAGSLSDRGIDGGFGL